MALKSLDISTGIVMSLLQNTHPCTIMRHASVVLDDHDSSIRDAAINLAQKFSDPIIIQAYYSSAFLSLPIRRTHWAGPSSSPNI